jgi:hypothetical protein
MQANKRSIIADASTYIKDLKQKISKLNQEIACTQNTTSPTLCEEPSQLVRIDIAFPITNNISHWDTIY